MMQIPAYLSRTKHGTLRASWKLIHNGHISVIPRRFNSTNVAKCSPEAANIPKEKFQGINRKQDILPETEKEKTQILINIIKDPLQQVLKSNKSIGKLAPQDALALSKSFEKRLTKSIHNFYSKIDTDNIETPSLSILMNPTMNDIAPILLTVLNKSPNVQNIWKVSTKREAISLIFDKLLNKECAQFETFTGNLQGNEFDRHLDYTRPDEWFPETRQMKRKIIMHVGPTNSGKTYHALKILEKAKTGYYAGPLRLLAREIYEKFLEKGIKCNLITGEEVIPNIDEFGNAAGISSGTIEMIPTNKSMDVCIIDEIQMISDSRRGEAWTNALLGVQAKKVYCCGEASAVPLVKKIAAITGDEVEVHEYKRLGDLKPTAAINSFKELQRGDCVVAFSKLKILTYKREIEHLTKMRVGVVYGALPPEVRAKEAAKFNSGKYDVLVASDAIGMGLNLKINRVVFTTIKKFDGYEQVPLTTSQMKQIAGRAGRYTDSGPSIGYYTAMRRADLNVIKKAIAAGVTPLTTAIVWPTSEVWSKYVTNFSTTQDLYDIINYLYLMNRDASGGLFTLTDLSSRRDVFKVLRQMNKIKIPFETQYRLSMVPINLSNATQNMEEFVSKFFETLANSRTIDTFEADLFDETLMKQDPAVNFSINDGISKVSKLEEVHRLVLLFMWLSQRWPTVFLDKESASQMKNFLERKITDELFNLRRARFDRRKIEGEQRKKHFNYKPKGKRHFIK